jgi:hypothetical protein
MIRIAITAANAICSTLPEDAPLGPVFRQDGQCLIHIEAAAFDRLRVMRRPSERYSNVILRLFELSRRDASA